MTQPPQVLIREVRSWALEQGRMQTASMSDFLFHALRKVHLVGALKLIDREVADAYLTSVIPLALEACPAEERELLRTNLLTLRDSREIGSATIEAMHRIIQLTPSVIGAAKRFRELMAEAIAQFNGGSLPAAVAMLELADLVIAEKKLDPTVVDRVRSDAVESISSEQLRKYAENKTKHVLLRNALGFFPTLTRQSLLQELRGEVRPERRRALLGLLEAYGHAGRMSSLAELEVELARPPDEVDTYYLRKLIYLLHRI